MARTPTHVVSAEEVAKHPNAWRSDTAEGVALLGG
jgi:hypothetical protein